MKPIALLLLLLLAACAGGDQPLPHQATTPVLTEQALIAADGARLPLRVWLPDGTPIAVIAALHGFNDYRASFDLPAPKLAAAGIAFYAYDQRGFGAAPDVGHWAGEGVMQEDFYTLLRLLAQRHPGTPLYALGESMGGAVLLTALSHPAIDKVTLPPLAGAILVAPAVWSRTVMPWYQGTALWLANQTVPWLTLTGSGLKILPSDNFDMLRQRYKDPLVIKETRIDAVKGLCDLMDDALQSSPRFTMRGLALIAAHDEVIPADASDAMTAQLPASTRVVHYSDGYHMLLRDLHADRPIGDIVAFVRQSP